MALNKKILIAVLISSSLSIFLTYTYCKHTIVNSIYAAEANAPQTDVAGPGSDYQIKRMKGFEYIKPLLTVETKKQSTLLYPLKQQIADTINKYKQMGILQSASVYLRVFKKGSWISINDTETYLPGSLIKVAGLVAYMRMEELNPGILNRKLTFNSPKEFIPNQTFNSKQIELGKSYTIKELLKYMIAYSDNNATYLLNKNVDNKVFMELFKDLSITVPDLNNPNYKMNVNEYSTFLKVLYNSSYLSMEHSELAAELLAQCDFTKGMMSGLPKDIKIAHKFGEMGDATTRQLHESSIVYNKNTRFILTVMTKGYDITKLPPVLGSIARIVNTEMDTNPIFAASTHSDYVAAENPTSSK